MSHSKIAVLNEEYVRRARAQNSLLGQFKIHRTIGINAAQAYLRSKELKRQHREQETRLRAKERINFLLKLSVLLAGSITLFLFWVTTFQLFVGWPFR